VNCFPVKSAFRAPPQSKSYERTVSASVLLTQPAAGEELVLIVRHNGFPCATRKQFVNLPAPKMLQLTAKCTEVLSNGAAHVFTANVYGNATPSKVEISS
jgi:hypothetical protein